MIPTHWQRNYSTILAFVAACFLHAAPSWAQVPATIQFKSLAYSVKESAGNAIITVERLGSASNAVMVGIQTTNEIATAGTDYVATNGTITFPPGIRQVIFHIAILPDSDHESEETLTLQLKDPVIGDALIGDQNNATLTIQDDDTCGYVLSPTSRTLDWQGTPSNYLFSVQATNGCPWSATYNVPWIFAFGSGSTNGVVQYSVNQNTNHTARTGKIFVAGKAFTITQLGAPPQDFTPPTVTFSTPAAYARLTNLSEAIVRGKAIDTGTGGVDRVEFRLENAAGTNDYQFATDTTNWSANVTGLILGTNTVRVRAKDNAENFSTGVVRSFVVVSTSPLTVRTNGAGKIIPVLNGHKLEVGRTYTLTATTPARNFFTGWSGGISTNVAKLVFQMKTNLVLQANFVTNPFVATKGAYNGLFLFSDPDAIRHDKSGFFTAAVLESGAFSARATRAGKSIPFSGKFGLDGKFTNSFPQPGTNPITLRLSLDIGGDSAQLTGDLADGNFLSNLTTDRAKTSGATDFNGTYTLVIPGTNNPAYGPGGHSPGTLTVKAGAISFIGSLADGTPVTQKVPLSQDGSWPFFQTLYAKGGSMLGWIDFTSRMEDDLHGDLSWIKPGFTKSPLYTNGFLYRATASGSRYRPSTGPLDPVLDFTNATLGFTGGNLIEAFTNQVVLINATKLLNLSSNKLTFTLTKANGSFSGTVTDPNALNSRKTSPYKGVVHQKGSYGAGFSPGTNETSAVRLEKVP